MKNKILILIFIILMFIPIGLCDEIKNINTENNTKIYYEKDKTIDIYDKNNEKSMDIKLISTISDIDKFIKIVKITNFKTYKPNKKQDFITKTKKIYGKNNIYKIEYFIEKYNYTFDYIIINETIYNNKTGKNEIKLINKTIIKDIKPLWVKFEPYNKQILKNETFKLKIIHYKKPELGFFKIQTIPIFKNIECNEFTWWNGNWNLKRAILINNINGNNVTNYSLMSINLSQYQINATSTRIINITSGLQESFWNESIDDNGNLEYVWCNFSSIINNTWINDTYELYYQSIPNVNSVSNGTKTFKFFDNFKGTSLDITNKWIILSGTPIINNALYLNDDERIYTKTWSGNTTSIRAKINCPNEIGSTVYSMFSLYDNINDECSFLTYFNWDIRSRIINGNELTTITQYNGLHIFEIKRNSGIENKYYLDNILKDTDNIYISNNYLPIFFYKKGVNDLIVYWVLAHNYTINEPELWIVGNIEYPEDLDMNCSLKVITHLTEKEIKVVNMTGDIVNITKSNECINLSYDSYIIYMSNPVKISSFTELLNTIDNVFIQLFLFAFLIVIGIIFFTFLQIIKNKGFKGVTK